MNLKKKLHDFFDVTFVLNIIRDRAIQFWVPIAFLFGIISYSITHDWTVASLIFTVIIFIWYSYETRGVRIETRETNRLAVFPALTLRYVERGNGDWMLLLSNQGKGVALNPYISTEQGTMIFALDGVTAIHPGDSVPVSYRPEGLNSGEIRNLNGFLKHSIKVKVEFSSALDLGGRLWTEHTIKNPPYIEISSTNWI